MIRPAALIMAIAMGAVTTGTYYGLNQLPQGLIPPPIGRAPPEDASRPPPKPAAEAAPAAAAPAPAPAPAEPAAEPALTESDIDEVPPAELQTAAAAPAEEPAPPSPEKSDYTPPPALVDEPARPAPARAKAETPATAADGAESATTPTRAASAAGATAERRPAPPEADLIKPWWPDASRMPADQLKLQYAGQVQGERAIALLFSAPLNLQSLKQHAQIRSAAGAMVGGDWELGKNPRLAVFRGVESGRYTVILAPQVADSKGFMLGQTLQGPVYIKP